MAHAIGFSVIVVATLAALGNAQAAPHHRGATSAKQPHAFSDIAVRRHVPTKALVRSGGRSTEASTPVQVFLNPYGIELVGGDDDPARNSSWIVAGSNDRVTFPAYRGGARAWQAITACVRNAYRDFAVDFTDQRPNRGGYSMIIVGGTPNLLGLSSETGGIAPADGVVLRNAVGFVFSANAGERTDDVCEAIVHEVGHTLGLDHAYRCEDPMSYLDDCGPKTFADVEAACGEYEARTCDSGKATQNSYRKLMALVGPRATTTTTAPALPTTPPPPAAPPISINRSDDIDSEYGTVDPYSDADALEEAADDSDDNTNDDSVADDDDSVADDDNDDQRATQGQCPHSHPERRVVTRRWHTRQVTQTTKLWARGRDGNWYVVTTQTRRR